MEADKIEKDYVTKNINTKIREKNVHAKIEIVAQEKQNVANTCYPSHISN